MDLDRSILSLIESQADVENIRGSKVSYSDGTTEEVKKIGKGMFSVAYLTQGKKREVLVVTKEGTDYSKEILANIGVRNKYLPNVKKAGYTPDGSPVFRMPLYKAPLRKSDSPKAWEQYKVLKACWDEAEEVLRRSSRGDTNRSIHSGHEIMDAVVKCARTSKKVKMPPAMKKALELLRSHSANYGAAYSFEFSPRNLATDARGNLILLDVVFSREVVARMRNQARRAVRGW